MDQAQNTEKGQSAAEALDGALDRALADNRIVGAVVLMAEDGETVYSRALGLADREAGREMVADSWFRYSSVSKPFTTVAALRLMQEGRLSPEDPVAHWLPEFTPRLSDGSQPEITVNHLLSHMAGLDYGFGQLPGGSYETAGVADGISERGISLGENIRRIASVPIDLIPGKDWRYSVSTDVLGAVIEAVTDSALPFAMAELVTGPLALDAAYFLPDTRHLAAAYVAESPAPRRMEGVTHAQGNLPEGYRFSYDPDRITDLSAFPSGGGGMAGTAEAALTLLETLRAGEFIAPEWRRAAALPRFDFAHPMRGPGMSHAWAGAVVTDPGLAGIPLSPGSLSWGGIYGHSWFIEPKRKRTLLVMTNTAVEGMAGQLSLEAMLAIAQP